ncbi:hypothetical protein [Bifidobacterium xylocopae]|uniref:hypothetical protein n=1 Tax=Bifidobacterium xylocopae TaxID=2493119 RepID=UPI000FDEBF84|nr:hypothetical protein [Bifidobacterium xylocopae]
MSWRHWICDARDGRLICPIDIPSFSWDMGIGDFGFSTTDKGAGKIDESGLTLPWAAIPASTPDERSAMLDSQRRAIVTTWAASDDPEDKGTPLFWGKITGRDDTWLDTSFGLESPMAILSSRYAVRDGAFKDGHSSDSIAFTGMSYRGICSELGRIATDGKQGGELPFDWTYTGERGSHDRTDYQAWNVQNLAVDQLLTNIANCQGGPDIAFRPYWADEQHIRVRFLAGSDADVYLDMDHSPVCLSSFPDGGSLEDIHVSYQDGYHRWYATGAGTDQGTLTCYVESMAPITQSMDPPVLREAVYGDTDTDNLDLLRRHVGGVAQNNSGKLMQITGSIDFGDTDQFGVPLHPLGSMWPGESVTLSIAGFPTLPDGDYGLRLMEMSGDQGSKADLKFDVLEAPFQ